MGYCYFRIASNVVIVLDGFQVSLACCSGSGSVKLKVLEGELELG